MTTEPFLWPWSQEGLSGRSEATLAQASNPTVAGDSETTAARSPFIVFFEEDAPGQGKIEARAQGLLNSLDSEARPSLIFDQLNGFVVDITEREALRLRRLGGVKSVEADTVLYLEPPIPGSSSDEWNSQPLATRPAALNNYGSRTASSGEILPWGVQAVWQGADISQQGNFAAGTYAFVIDSGVLNTTGDLNLAGGWHRSWVSGETPFTDGNGHGTHVAGTIAALANGVGVVGVAPGAQVVSLKVFDSAGGGASSSSIIEAINYATFVINTNQLDKSKVVVNMSLGGGYNPSIDTAIRNAADQGIRFVVAAGNSGQDADGFSPASAGNHPNVYTISAVDSTYKMASFSNWDLVNSLDTVDNVDFAAPGVGVLSYYKNGQLTNLSGTSMAAPHVSGLLLAGGVQAGDLVTPHYSGTADPFAWGIQATAGPATATPTYNIAASASSIAEGQNFTINLATTNVAQGTPLYWEIAGSGISTGDFSNLSTLVGSVSTDAAGKANLNIAISLDLTTEGNETLTFNLFSDSTRTTKVGTVAATLQDTSTAPVTTPGQILWGTTANDVITGGSGNDKLSGVLASGTSAAALGRRQMDVLTGGLGADIFVLGDARGVFYNDGSNGNLGAADYARITDFQTGIDKLQLRRASYFTTVTNGVTSVYWDRNANNQFDTTGNNRDELIAMLEGVTTLSSSDVLYI
jgi:hypothetical protein